MIPRFKPLIIFKQLISTLTFFSSRDFVGSFEDRFLRKSKSNFAISFGYGRSTLYTALKACKVEGKKNICPSYTCVVVPHAIKYASAEPIFIDSMGGGSFNMDNSLIDKAMD